MRHELKLYAVAWSRFVQHLVAFPSVTMVQVQPTQGVGAGVGFGVGLREEGLEGSLMSVVRTGVRPSAHTHAASPNSNPFDCPSPSESLLQNARDHTNPAFLKSIPN